MRLPWPAGALSGLCPACLLQQGSVDSGPEPAAKFIPPTPSELSRFFPQLEILELIGKGGMGAVYKARQRELDRLVAVKILPPVVSDDPAFAERFAREAKALAKLNHPNIVAIHDFGRADGLFYFVMEFVDGVNLRQLLHTGRVAPREALAIVPQICDALQYAHDAGIVHRDIKPENILLDRQGRVKVADFGLAKLMGTAEPPAPGATAPTTATTEAGQVMGTPQYMAPEQRDNPADVDHRADIYSLGVVLYQMLTGELPGKKLDPPSKKVVIDVRLDAVVLRALEKKPELRYQTAADVKTVVETIVTTAPPEVGTPTGGSPSCVDAAQRLHSTTPTKEVQWFMWGLGAVVLAVLLVVGMLALVLPRPWNLIVGISGIASGVGVGLFFLIFVLLCPKQFCWQCRAQLPKIRIPRTISQALRGGWTCPKCGCELDRHARPASGRSSPPPVVDVPASGNLPKATTPPSHEGSPVSSTEAEAYSKAILSRDYELNISSCLQRGWNLVMKDFWRVAGVTLLIELLSQAAFSTVIGSFVVGPLMGGLWVYYLKRVRGEHSTLNTAFSGFGNTFVSLCLTYLVMGLLKLLAFCCLILPGIYFFVAWTFAIPLAADRGLSFSSAMKLSRRTVRKHWWKLLGFLIVLGLLNVLGYMLCYVGLIATIPVTMAALVYAYEDIFGVNSNKTSAAAPNDQRTGNGGKVALALTVVLVAIVLGIWDIKGAELPTLNLSIGT
ncbi:MAG: hypothetical protein FJ395_05670 [Verrucomicrobia bacterium]|nr:hypothetical protein [Verrucomicrobiota bacterium]